MTKQQQDKLGQTLWKIADDLRGAMNADDVRDYMLSFLFLRYLSSNYEAAAKKELGSDYPSDTPEDVMKKLGVNNHLEIWYLENSAYVDEFEQQMRRKVHYVIKPQYLWSNITEMARKQNDDLLVTVDRVFKYIQVDSFVISFQDILDEIIV